MLKLILSAFIFLSSFLLSAQSTVKNPQICNDQLGRFRNYFDGAFNITYKDGKFEKWNTSDSIIRFFELGRSLELFLKPDMNPIKITATNEGVSFTFQNKIYLIKDSTVNNFSINDITFLITASNWSCSSMTQIGNYNLELNFNKFDKIWKWDKIFITKGSISFFTSYNCFHYAGPESFIIQDHIYKYGTSISNSFNSNKYIWWIKPAYYEDHKVTLLSEFEFYYSKKGVFKKSKSFGSIQTCNSD